MSLIIILLLLHLVLAYGERPTSSNNHVMDVEEVYYDDDEEDEVPVAALPAINKRETDDGVIDESFERFKKLVSPYTPHYRMEMYKGFSIEKALLEWQQQEFSVNYYDPARGRLIISGKVNIWERSTSHIVKDLCSVLVDEPLKAADPSAWLRCTIPATQTVRMRTVQLIANISQYYEYAPFEEEIFAYLHAYQSVVLRPGMTASESLTSPLAGKACVLGSPTPHLLLSIFGSGMVGEVITFYRPYKVSSVTEMPSRNTTWDAVDAYKAAKFFNVSLTMLPYSSLLEEYWKYRNNHGKNGQQSDYAHICDSIHISADIFPSTVSRSSKEDYAESIIPLAKFLSQRNLRLKSIVSNPSQDDPHEYIARVIWQNRNQQLVSLESGEAPRLPGSKYINWKFSSTWFDLTYVSNRLDRNGFIDKTFNMWQQKSPFRFSTIEIGYFKTLQEHDMDVEIQRDGSNTLQTRPLSSPPSPDDKDFIIVIITATYRILIDNIFSLQSQLNELGYRNVLLFSEMTIQQYESYEAIAKKINAKIIHLVLSPMDLGIIAKDNVIFNSEPAESRVLFHDGEPRYRYLFARALQLWHFRDKDNTIEVLKSFENKNPKKKKLRYVPFYYPSNRLQVLHNMGINAVKVEPFGDHSIRLYPNSFGVVFFGGCSDRRNIFLDTLREELSSRQSADTRKITFLNFCGHYTHDYERDYFLVNADVVINVNMYEDSSLETHRINHLLSLGKVVISEPGASPEVTDVYRGGVIFVNTVKEMADALTTLANDRKSFNVARADAILLQYKIRDVSSQLLKETMVSLHYALFGGDEK